MQSRSMPMPRPPAGGMRVLEGPDEVVVHLGHRVLGLLAGELAAEELFLQERVVELGVGVGQLDPVDEQLEPLGDRRVRRLPLGERADRGRIVDDEDRARQGGLRRRASNSSLAIDVGVLAGGRDAGRLGPGLDRREIGGIDAGVFGEQLGIGPARPGGREVERRLAPRTLRNRRRCASIAPQIRASVRSIMAW